MTPQDRFAEELIRAHRTGTRADARALPSPTYDEALAIQSMVQAQLGPVGGFKVARRPDGPPAMAPISAHRVLGSGAQVAVRDRMGIELEVGFEVIAQPDDDPGRPVTDLFRPRIVLELVDTRLDGAAGDPMKTFTDMQINDGLIVGPALAGWTGEDFGSLTASLTCGAQQIIDGERQVPGGSALANLALLRAHIGDHCGGLRMGQIVITGSISGLDYVPAGTDVSGRIEDLGQVTCRLV